MIWPVLCLTLSWLLLQQLFWHTCNSDNKAGAAGAGAGAGGGSRGQSRGISSSGGGGGGGGDIEGALVMIRTVVI